MTPGPDLHPSQEALAEFAGRPGDLDGAGRAAGADGPSPEAAARIRDHLAACARCRDEVAMLRSAASALATLAEPALPPGLHERLVAAVRAEQRAQAPAPADSRVDSGVGSRAGSGPVPLTRQRARRRPARTWRSFGWAVAAAAVAVLVVGGVSELARKGGGIQIASGGGGSADSGTSGGGSPALLDMAGVAPRFQAAGEYDLARLRDDIADRPDMQAAYQTAFDAARRSRTPAASRSTGSGSAAPSAETPNSTKQADQGIEGSDSTAAGCPEAAAGAGTFLVDADYRGRPATLVVSVSGDPPVVTMRAYARDDCTALGTEQGPAPPPAP